MTGSKKEMALREQWKREDAAAIRAADGLESPPVMPPPREPHVCGDKGYCIHECKFGVAISGGVPVSELKSISEKYGMGKTAVASMRIAHTLGMALVFCKDADDEQAWWDMILFMNDLKDTPYPAPGNAGA